MLFCDNVFFYYVIFKNDRQSQPKLYEFTKMGLATHSYFDRILQNIFDSLISTLSMDDVITARFYKGIFYIHEL